MPGMVQAELFKVVGVQDADVEIVWDPTWNPGMMAETAKMQLNMFT
jgi:metal-sulfur cluster biosynthetic enzyme